MSYYQIIFVFVIWLAASVLASTALALRWYEGFGTDPVRLKAFQLAGIASCIIGHPKSLGACMGAATAIAGIWWGLLWSLNVDASWDHFATIALVAPAIGYLVIFGLILRLGKPEPQAGKPESTREMV